VSGSVTGSTGLTVNAIVTLQSLAVAPASFTIAPGATQQLTVTGTYSNGSTQNLTSAVTWSSSNTADATVSTSGLVTGIASGSATIKAVSGSLSVSSTAPVSPSTLPNPQAWWKLSEGSGTSGADSPGTGSTGTLFGGANWTTGKVGKAVQSPASGG